MSGVSPNALNPNIALSAGTGSAAPQTMNSQQFADTLNSFNRLRMFPGEQQLQQQQIQSGQLGLAQGWKNAAYQGLVPLLGQNGPITHQQVTDALASTEANRGIPTHGVINDILATAPTGDGPDFDARVRSMIASNSQTNPEAAVGMVTPRPGPQIDNGPNIYTTTINPAGSTAPGQIAPTTSYQKGFSPTIQNVGGQTQGWINGVPVTATPNTLSPEAASQPTTVMGPNGVPITAPRSAVAPVGVVAPNQRVTPSSGQMPVIGGPPGSPTDGRLSSQTQIPGYGGTPFAGPTAGQSAVYQNSAQAFSDAQKQAANYPSDMTPLNMAYNDLKSGKTVTGYGSAWYNSIKSNVNTLAKELGAPQGPWDEDTATYAAARKALTQIQRAQPGALGSNQQLETAQQASASTEINPAAARLLLRTQIGLRRMQQAAYTNFQASGGDPNQWSAYQANFMSHADPRVYQFDMLSTPQRQSLLNSMNPAQRNSFTTQLQQLDNQGLFTNG